MQPNGDVAARRCGRVPAPVLGERASGDLLGPLTRGWTAHARLDRSRAVGPLTRGWTAVTGGYGGPTGARRSNGGSAVQRRGTRFPMWRAAASPKFTKVHRPGSRRAPLGAFTGLRMRATAGVHSGNMWTSPIPIILSSDLAGQGRRSDVLAQEAARSGGELIRIRRGVYVRRSEFSSLSRQQAHVVKVIAARLTGALDGAVLARESAAVIHGIPLVGAIPQQVQVVRPGRDGGRMSSGIRTLRAGHGFQTVLDDGVPVASVAQTLADLGRRRPLRDVLAGFDAMLRAGRVTKEDIAAAAPERSRGRPRLYRTIEVADPNAESPGESLSRAVMIEHHLPMPALQEPVRDQHGGLLGRVDFIWPEHGVIGEFDGRVKYGRELTGRPVDEVLLAERRRELDIESATGMRVVRWLWDDAWREQGLLEILAGAGIRPVR